MVHELHSVVDHWKIGKLNHFPDEERKTNWPKFRADVERALLEHGASYYLKHDLVVAR
jgi:hypothetical protein